MLSDRESIVAYLRLRADQHTARGGDQKNGSYHRGTATLFRALADDVEASLDRA